MKYFCKKNIVIIVSMAVIFAGLCGCRKAPVFVDADTLETVAETISFAAETEAGFEMASQSEPVESAPQSEEALIRIMVHICGAVVSPGVYELDSGSRVIDAVRQAEGLLPQAASDYVNLAAFVADGDKVWIPTVQEAEELYQDGKEAASITASGTGSDVGSTSSEHSAKININTADKELLCTLPGIGSTRAESIIAYREQNGSFHSIQDIMNVSGIKDSSFQKIKEYITVK